MAAVKRHPVLHHSAVYIYISFEIRIPLKSLQGCVCSLANYMLHIKRLFKNQSSISVLWVVLCFKMYPFRFLLAHQSQKLRDEHIE